MTTNLTKKEATSKITIIKGYGVPVIRYTESGLIDLGNNVEVCGGSDQQSNALDLLGALGVDTVGCRTVTWHMARSQPIGAIATFRVRPRDPKCWIVREGGAS